MFGVSNKKRWRQDEMGALEKLNISSPLASRHAETGLLIHSAAAPHLLLLLKGAAKSANGTSLQ